MFHVILIVIPIALVAKVRLAQEPFVRIIVTIFLDQPDDLVGRDWSLIDDHVCWIDRHDFDLISRECCLKLTAVLEYRKDLQEHLPIDATL